ncbi:MAG: hypothetical protein WCO63_15420 [Bacteroidota bacterium]
MLVVYVRKNIPESDIWLEHKRLTQLGDATIKSPPWFSQFTVLFKKPYRKLFILCLILAIFDLSAYWFTYSWMPGYLTHERSFTLAKSTMFIFITH